MGTTASRAIRYPESTDRVADGATAMQNLANDVDALLKRIKSGVQSITFAAGIATGTVNFPTPFPAGVTPSVQLTAFAITGNTTATPNLTGVTNTGFTYRVQQQATGTTYAGSVNLHWTATDLT